MARSPFSPPPTRFGPQHAASKEARAQAANPFRPPQLGNPFHPAIQRAANPAPASAADVKSPAVVAVPVDDVKVPASDLPKHFFHATEGKYALAIATEGLKPMSENAYLCMSGEESGATTKFRQASDVVFRVKTSQLTRSDWKQEGAGQAEWRSSKPIPAHLLEWRKFLPLNNKDWHKTSVKLPPGPKPKTKSAVVKTWR